MCQLCDILFKRTQKWDPIDEYKHKTIVAHLCLLDRIETDTAVPGKQADLRVQYFYRYERSQLHWCIWPPNLVNFKFFMVKTDISSNYVSPKLHISVSLLSFNASLKWHSFKWLHKNEEVLTITHWISWFLCLGMMAGLQSMDLHNQLALHSGIEANESMLKSPDWDQKISNSSRCPWLHMQMTNDFLTYILSSNKTKNVEYIAQRNAIIFSGRNLSFWTTTKFPTEFRPPYLSPIIVVLGKRYCYSLCIVILHWRKWHHNARWDIEKVFYLHLSIAPSQLPQLCQTAYDLSHTSVKDFLCAHFSFLSISIQTKLQP